MTSLNETFNATASGLATVNEMAAIKSEMASKSLGDIWVAATAAIAWLRFPAAMSSSRLGTFNPCKAASSSFSMPGSPASAAARIPAIDLAKW